MKLRGLSPPPPLAAQFLFWEYINQIYFAVWQLNTKIKKWGKFTPVLGNLKGNSVVIQEKGFPNIRKCATAQSQKCCLSHSPF